MGAAAEFASCAFASKIVFTASRYPSNLDLNRAKMVSLQKRINAPL